MTGSKKKYILLSLGAFLLCGGVLTYALTDSNLRKHVDNPVTPATIAIALQEQVGTEATMGDNTNPEYENTLTWSKETDGEETTGYTAVKQVQVTNLNQDDANNAAAYVRVCILPRWVTTMEGTDKIQVDVQCSAVGLSEIGALNSAKVCTALSVTNAHTYTLGDVTFTLDENWKEHWFFNSADGYFYYKTPLEPGESTAVLLKKVSISNDTYIKLLDSKGTQVISLVVDVLSDSIQTEGGAVEQRWSSAGVQINSQTGALETVAETTQ
jgi:hypothetical protein